LGKKDIIKIENYQLHEGEKKSIALISPSASFTEIRNFKVVAKAAAELPKIIKELIVCPNHNCITNLENMKSRFSLNARTMTLQCSYCEKKYTIDEVKFKRQI
jgi:aspartate carbamoyltransferase regulatory subunit